MFSLGLGWDFKMASLPTSRANMVIFNHRHSSSFQAEQEFAGWCFFCT